jgi:hypothetical protein
MALRVTWEIESLLRESLRGALAPVPNRDPLPGSVTFAGPMAGADRSGIYYLYGHPLSGAKKLYHGWLGWYPPDYPGGPPPARVYADTTLQAYLAGTGTDIPDSTRTEHLIGAATAHATETCVEDLAAPTWLDAVPTLDESDSYLWPMTQPTGGQPTAIWTGEARGMDQALIGAQRTWAEALPDGWTADSTGIGVYWLNGGLWAAWVGTAGMLTVQLSIPEPLGCILVWLVAIVPEAWDAALMRSWIYAHALALPDETVHLLLTESQMALCYADGVWSMHPMMGWQWRWQPLLTSPVGCVQTLTYGDGCYYSRKCSIDITLVDSLPHAVLTVGDTVAWGGPLFRFWTPSGNGLEVALQVAGTEVIGGAAATVYSFTTIDGGVCDVQRVPTTAAGTVSHAETWGSFCGAGNEMWINGSRTHSGAGGWQLVGAMVSDMATEVQTANSQDEMTGTVVSTGTVAEHDIYSPELFVYYCEKTGGAGWDRWQAHTDGDWSIECGAASCQEDVRALTAGAGGATLAFLPTDNGVVIGKTQSWGSGSVTHYARSFAQQVLVQMSGHYGWIRDPNPPHYAIAGTATTMIASNGPRLPEGGFSGAVAGWLSAGYGGYGVRAGATTTITAANAGSSSLALATSAGAVQTLDATAWPALFYQSQGSVADAPLARVTWLGASIWMATPTADATLPAGLSTDVLALPRLTPIGTA